MNVPARLEPPGTRHLGVSKMQNKNSTRPAIAGAKHWNWQGGNALFRHPLHNTHRMMLRRCYCQADPWFHLYGGRGITVCDRWRGKGGFTNFLADMGPKPEGTHPNGRSLYTLDRINNDGNYEPGNCRWATKAEQSRNSRKTRLNALDLDYVVCCLQRGITVAEIARRLGVCHTHVSYIRDGRVWKQARAALHKGEA